MLKDRANDTLHQALRKLDGLAEGGGDIRALLDGYRARLEAPMRVAVVGRVSSGKSTLTNALLGSRLVATGIEELTYNVNWLRHAPEPALVVHFRQGKTHRSTLDELERLTARREDNREVLAAIDYIEVLYDNPQLRVFDLIDTPGLDSHFGTDSQNTLRFLGRTHQDVRASTIEHAVGADALLLVFGRSMSRLDEETLTDFQREIRSASPITAIGVLTKVEHYWHTDVPDPMVPGRAVAARLMGEPAVRRLLYDVKPVCSLVGAAAGACGEEHLEALRLLAKVPEKTLAARVSRGPFFCTREYADLPLPAARRKPLFDLLGAWGIVLATRLVREGVDSLDQLRDQLLARSGMSDLREVVGAHFGNRAYLIKLQHVIDKVRGLPREVGGQGSMADAVAAVVNDFERLALNEPAFAELTVLRHHYNGRLQFGDREVEELLRVTGEHGVWITDRLGLASDATLDDMYATARQRLDHWARLTTDPTLYGETKASAHTLRRSYERLVFHVGEARRHLELVQ